MKRAKRYSLVYISLDELHFHPSSCPFYGTIKIDSLNRDVAQNHGQTNS